MRFSKYIAPINPNSNFWQENDSTTAAKNNDLRCASIPSHIVPETQDSWLWCRSCPQTELIPSVGSSSHIGHSPPPSSLPFPLLRTYFCKSIVISQEVAASAIFLAGVSHHRCCLVVGYAAEDIDDTSCRPPCNDALGTILVLCFVIFYCALRSSLGGGGGGGGGSSDREPIIQWNRIGALFSTDALVPSGIIIALLPSTVRTLTTSISPNATTALGTGAMALHVLTCDYAYANGRNGRGNYGGKGETHSGRRRTGGSFSMRCVLCSAVLFASRSSSGICFYLVVVCAVAVFVALPVAQNSFASFSGDSVSECAVVVVVVVVVLLSDTDVFARAIFGYA